MITDNLLEGSPMKLKNPVALVTGASSGIGKATAERLATAGYKVYGTSRRGATSGQRAFEMLSLDVTSDDSVAAAVNALLRSEGRLDLLVNNAGFSIAPAGAEESSIEQARSIFETNFFGILRMTRAVLPHMRRQANGRIVNVSSVLGFLPAPYMALYAATKHAIEGYSESLDHELRTRGIRVSVIEPASTNTQFDANLLQPDATLDEYREARAALAKRRYKARMEMMEVPRPEPGPGELLVRVRAAGVNPLDYKIRDGAVKVLLPFSFPLILGTDLAGDVEAIGPGVTKFKLGDAVYSRLDNDRIGAFAEYALVRESAAARKPARLDYTQAASLPLVGLTAWQTLIEIARLRAGQKVLIHAGSGGVGTFAIQLAKHLGAEVVTTAGAKNHALVKSLGADVAIDYQTSRFETVVKDQDVVLDTQGGDTLLRSFEVVKPGGEVVTLGGRPDGKFARAWGLSLPLVWILGFLNRKVDRLARKKRVRFEYLFMRASGEQLERLGARVDQGVIKPVLDKTFPFEAAAEAISYVESGRAVGKVVIRVAD